MSRKNFKVATAKKGETPKQDIKHLFATVKKDKTPTGKVKTLKSAEERKKAHEEQYRTFRINAMKRRAARMNVPEADIPKLVEKLVEQLDAPKNYNILLLFTKSEYNLIKEALKNNKIDYKILTEAYGWIDGDTALLAKLREIIPINVKIHPYAKKMESVLTPYAKKKTEKKPSNNTPEVAAKAKAARKAAKNLKTHKGYAAKFRKRGNTIRGKAERLEWKKKIKALKADFKALRPAKGTTTHKSTKNASESLKTRSNEMKKAA